MIPPKSISARNSSACCSWTTRTTIARSSSRWRFSRTISSIRADLFLSVELCRQGVHRGGDIAPLRKPPPRKAEGEIGTVDAALAQAHAGGRCIARAACVEARYRSGEQVFPGIGRTVAKRAHRKAVRHSIRPKNRASSRGLLQIARIDGLDAGLRRQRILMRGDRQEDAIDRLRHFFLDRVDADMLGRIRLRQRGIEEVEIDPLL